jgi:tricorn protease
MPGIWLLAALAAGAPHLGHYRHPTVHGDRVVFASEGDLFSVSAGGGDAVRLTTHPGEESHPRLSPDGQRVAFIAQRDGVTDVYVMPADGGAAERLTWDGVRVAVVGWTPRGEVLVRRSLDRTLPGAELQAIDAAGRARRIPLDRAAEGAFAGDTLFFTRPGKQRSQTKRYRGGTGRRLWRWDGEGAEAQRLTDAKDESHHPVVDGQRVYFLSDRDGTTNLWSMRFDGSDRRQHTRFHGLGATGLDGHDGRFVLSVGSDLHRHDAATGRTTRLDVRLVSDLDQRRRRWTDEIWPHLESAHLSHDGRHVALTVRGRAFVAPTGLGRLRSFGEAGAGRVREATFAGPSDALWAFGDGGDGEMNLYRFPEPGAAGVERQTDFGPGFRSRLVPSPDGARVAFRERDHTLRVTELATGRTVVIDRSEHGDFTGATWSPGGRYLAYAGPEVSGLRTIRVYDRVTGRTGRITSDRRHSYDPAFSSDGAWLYFLSDLRLKSAVPSPWGTYQPEPYFEERTRIVALPVAGPARSPFAPWDELHPEPDAPEDDADGDDAPRPDPVFSWDAPADRLVLLPVPPGDYSTLSAVKDRLYWLSHAGPFGDPEALKTLEIRPRDREGPEPKTVTDDVSGYSVSGDGERLLVRRDKEILVVPAKDALPDDLGPHRLDLEAWKMPIDPVVEWRQMFHEAWRLERDYFYDPNLHGVDWPAIRERYLPLVDRVSSREELNDVVAQMVSELSALHTFVFGGDVREEPYALEPGDLGARTRRVEGGHVIEHIYVADPDRLDLRSPLIGPDRDVREGDVIRAVDGRSTAEAPSLAPLLLGRAGHSVRLRLTRPGREATFDVLVEPLTPREAADLRYAEWEHTRRLRVEEASRGRVGYVHLRSMGGRDIGSWAEQFYPVFDRAGLIIDVRNNRGGNIDSWILEKLLRRAWFYWQPRAGAPYANMQYAFRGHVVVLVNEWTASDGEAFAEGFRRLGLGKVYGVRTWGGEIWLSFDTGLADGGMASVAQYGVYGPEGAWLIEGHGVDPDVVVENPPHATFRGEDAQLERALADLLAQIEADPRPLPPAPPYPDKSEPEPPR